jgi:hypothetical protein
MNGITFEQRNVRALDDARLYETLYEDGKIRGCDLTFSGAGLTVSKGAYIVRGRMIAIDSDTTYTASPTYSNGYGRLKLTIDLAQAPSDSSFTQGSIAWQYASTNSFAALVQEDVNNGTDTDYEIEICRVKFASGNVSEILTEIGSVGIIRGLFGLGLSLTTGDDLDNCKTPGALYATAGLSVSHAPASVAYKILVIQIAPGVIMQFALTAAAKIYMRVYSGSWTGWTSGIEAVTDLPTTYNEGDVYVKV